jgi:hypothetical protein
MTKSEWKAAARAAARWPEGISSLWIDPEAVRAAGYHRTAVISADNLILMLREHPELAEHG